jgi:Rrf2 family transcriptional regulator, cysteine metabolism repressor
LFYQDDFSIFPRPEQKAGFFTFQKRVVVVYWKASKEKTAMKFSTKSRYALRLMAELARYAPGSTVSLKEISERQQLSLKYLEQIVTPLARVGLVKSERGSQGGYRLTKAPADYTAGEILRAIEGSVAPIPCLGSETNECPMSDQCFTLPFWAGLDDVINQYIDSVTLEQLAQSLPAVKEGCGCCGTKS